MTPSFWDDPAETWTAGEPERVLDVLAQAYRDQVPTIGPLLTAAGVEAEQATGLASAREIWAAALLAATASGRVLHLITEVLDDDSVAAFHPPLRRLLGGQHKYVEVQLLLRHIRTTPPSSWTAAQIESVVAASTPPGPDPVKGLQAITSVPSGLGDPAAYAQAILDGIARTAVIEVGGRARGTGFLVGADLVLTAAHVLDARVWPPDPGLQVEVVFDYKAQPDRSMAEVGQRVPVAEIVTGSLPMPDEVTSSDPSFNAGSGHLDFALLRLGCSPLSAANGTGRGAYALSTNNYNFAAGGQLLVIHHPLGEGQHLTFANTGVRVNAGYTRVRYGGNTLAGSSGAPVINERGQLVALHHYSGGTYNQGIPISAIAQNLTSGEYAALFNGGAAGAPAGCTIVRSGVDPFEATAFMGRPFVNRGELRRLLRQMAESTGAARTLVISGAGGTGVSYSYKLAAYVASNVHRRPALQAVAPDGIGVVYIDLRKYIALGLAQRRERIAGDLLVGLRMAKPGDPLAQAARDLTTLGLWITAELSGKPGRQWWVFFDGIDNLVAVKQGDVDELIHTVVGAADDPQVPLRVVLAGQVADEFAREGIVWREEDVARGLTRTDVEEWCRTRAHQLQRPIPETDLQAELDALFPGGAPLPEPRDLGPRLPSMLVRLIGADDAA
jgi:trypsin-like peptidase